jgi:predicted CxxxxCH...CXXCH cytochrome family protein
VDVVFRKKKELPALPDSMFVWDRTKRSCSNVECHLGAPDGASIERTDWDQQGEAR